MAQDEIIIKLRVEDGALKVSTANIDKQSKAIDKSTKKKKQGTKASNRFNKSEKALYQTNLSGSKAFSKMNQTMGGSSGLVAAYATLAANVFAATAAFGALSRAAQFENLKKGLQELGAQSGRTLSLVANRLREVTGNAISMEEAMRSAAMGISGGFGGKELEGLAKIAKGASITLGRSLPDAFDRLTRGAIKLEPEILDELGIMVRVDEAAQAYAATIGKTASSLTQMEKRQAFMNAILEQGESKFGAIADELDADPYSKLASTFHDLTQAMFSFINETLKLGAVVGYLGENIFALAGVMILLGSTILGKMLPMLGDAGGRALKAAEQMHNLADGIRDAGSAQQKMKIMGLAKGMEARTTGEKAYLGQVKAIQKLVAEGKQDQITTKKLNELKTKNSQILSGLTRKGIKRETVQSASHKASVIRAKTEQRNIQALIVQEEVRIKLKQKALVLDTIAAEKAIAGGAIQAYQAGAQSFRAASSTIAGGYKNLAANLNLLSAKAAGIDPKKLSGFTIGMNKLKAATVAATGQMQLLGAAFLKALPWIGALIAIAAVLYGIYQKIYNTKEHKEYVKSVEDLDTIFNELPKKAQAYERAVNNVRNLADAQVNSWKVVSGVITEVTEAMTEMADKRLLDTRNFGSDFLDAKVMEEAEDWMQTFADNLASGSAQGGLAALPNMGEILDVNTLQAKEGIIALLVNQTEEEVVRMEDLLGQKLPEITEQLARGLNEALKEVTDETTRGQFLTMLRKILVDAESVLGALGPTAEALGTSFKEGEKAATNFFKSFRKKTSVDELKESLDSITSTFKDFKAAVGEAGKKEVVEFAKKFLDIGPGIAKLIGPEFESLQQKLRKASVNLDEQKKVHGATSDEYKTQLGVVQKILEQFGLQELQLGNLFKNVDSIQKAERQRKTINDQITKAITLQQKIYKKSTVTAGLNVKLNIQQLKMSHDELKNKADVLKLNEKIFKGVETAAILGDVEEISFSDLQKRVLTEEELGIILSENIVKKEDMNDQNTANFKTSMANAKLENTIGRLGTEIQLQTNEALKEQLSLEEDILKLQRTNNQLQQQHTNFIRKGTTDLDAGATALLAIETAQQEYEFAISRAKVEKEIIAAKGDLMVMEAKLLNAQIKIVNATLDKKDQIEGIPIDKFEADIAANTALAQEAIDLNVINLRDAVVIAIDKAFKGLGEALKSGAINLGEYESGIIEAKEARTTLAGTKAPVPTIIRQGDTVGGVKHVGIGVDPDTVEETGVEHKSGAQKVKDARLLEARESLEVLRGISGEFNAMAANMGPEGETFIAINEGMFRMADGIMNIADTAEGSKERIAAVMGTIAGAIASIGAIQAAASKQRVAAIDQEIAAEKKRDGKSKQSLAKIRAMEAKKEAEKRKAFEQNKKMMIASTIMNTASGIMMALNTSGNIYVGIAMAALTAAMGMAQLSIIQGMTYQGGGASDAGAGVPSTINIGERGNKVDVSQRASAGELAYLRGARGIGTSSTSFTATGGAAGMRRGYADGGEILVGERGPETITPLSPMQVWPSDMGAKSQINANFTIHAIDAQGVEDVLLAQQGNIISMIRSAANDHGTEFLEEVNTDMYGEPKSAGGIDY